MRNISFSLTKSQFLDGSKDVTRRNGWWFLKPGDRLMGCEKCMGRKPGEPLVRLGVIEVVDARPEKLEVLLKGSDHGLMSGYAMLEVVREGFPGMSPANFVAFFLRSHKGITASSSVNRIQFKHVP